MPRYYFAPHEINPADKKQQARNLADAAAFLPSQKHIEKSYVRQAALFQEIQRQRRSPRHRVNIYAERGKFRRVYILIHNHKIK